MNLLSSIKKSVRAWVTASSARSRGRSARRPGFRPALECLEERQLPSTLFLTPHGNDATHFSTFGQAYSAAQKGDVIQVEPGAVVSDPCGTVVIDKSITVQGDPAFVPARVTSNLSTGSHGKPVLQNLDCGGVNVVLSDDSTVTKSILGGLFCGEGDTISNNTIKGAATMRSLDRILANRFVDGGCLKVIDLFTCCVTVKDNSFNTSAQTAIEVPWGHNLDQLTLTGNTIRFSAPSARTIGFDAEDMGTGFMSGNVFDTGGLGTGLRVNPTGQLGDSSLQIQYNDFNCNAVGVLINGSAGDYESLIDLGGGPLNSLGHNNFQDYSGWDGRFAIVLESGYGGGSAYTVSAFGNSWNRGSLADGWSFDPRRVIKDGQNHANQALLTDTDPYPRRGIGWILVDQPPPPITGVTGGSHGGYWHPPGYTPL